MRKTLTIALGCLLSYSTAIHSNNEPYQQNGSDTAYSQCCPDEAGCQNGEGFSCCADCDEDVDIQAFIEYPFSPTYECCSCMGAGCPLCTEPLSDAENAYDCGLSGVWLPEDPPFFRPFIADPRQITYSVGWRFDDQVCARNVIDVSYGDSLPIYEWWNVWPGWARMRVELEGALWAVFDPLHESSPLINADYYVGIPLTYSIDRWAFRLRIYHISSHIGDEFLLNNLGLGFKRLNPSAEYLDFFASYYFADDFRFYGGLGYILHQDESFECSRFYAETGMELRLREVSYTDNCNRIYGVPIFGAHFRFRKEFKRHLDATYILGYEWTKLCGLYRKVRIYLEYHDGYSVEGQFCLFPTNYLAIRASYGF